MEPVFDFEYQLGMWHASCAERCAPPGFKLRALPSCCPLPPVARLQVAVSRLPLPAMVVTSTSLETKAAAAAYNQSHTRLAIADTGGRLTFWQREGGGRGWTLAGTLPLEGLRVTSLCWGATQFGGLLAGGAADGSVVVWQEQPGDAGWRLAALLKEGSLGVQDLAFAPPELGPLLAVAYADGAVRCVKKKADRVPGSGPACTCWAAMPTATPGRHLAQSLCAPSWPKCALNTFLLSAMPHLLQIL